MRLSLLFIVACVLTATCRGAAGGGNDAFRSGLEAYRAGQFAEAARAFRAASAGAPSSGALLNLGLSEWRRGRVGAALVAWEQARWLDPFDSRARANLRYARQFTGVEVPDLAWYEHTSTWLPANAWAWIAGGSFWLSVGLAVLPGILRWRRSAWTQALAAIGLAIFLACLPAQVGVVTRTQIGFVLQKSAPLRLTPTQAAETVAKLGSGEAVRAKRSHGQYVLVRTAQGQGWIEQKQLGLVCPRPVR